MATAKVAQGSTTVVKCGVVNAFQTVWNVKPGHEEQLRQAIGRFNAGLVARIDMFIKVTVHHATLLMFDNDQRFYFDVSFDMEWDPYMDDVFKQSGNGILHHDVLQHCVGGPGPELPQDKWTSTDLKNMIQAHRVYETVAFAVTLPDMTLGESVKARSLLRAFQQVLDNPKAAQALQDPVLKPLLDLAAA
jgi:hypothetical protein